MIFDSAAAVAGAVAGNNKSELLRLGLLAQLFKE